MLPAMLALAGGCSDRQPVSHLDWMTDVPTPGCDGESVSDFAVWRRGAAGTFFVKTGLTAAIMTRTWAQTGDSPVAYFSAHF